MYPTRDVPTLWRWDLQVAVKPSGKAVNYATFFLGGGNYGLWYFAQGVGFRVGTWSIYYATFWGLRQHDELYVSSFCVVLVELVNMLSLHVCLLLLILRILSMQLPNVRLETNNKNLLRFVFESIVIKVTFADFGPCSTYGNIPRSCWKEESFWTPQDTLYRCIYIYNENHVTLRTLALVNETCMFNLFQTLYVDSWYISYIMIIYDNLPSSTLRLLNGGNPLWTNRWVKVGGREPTSKSPLMVSCVARQLLLVKS